MNHNLGRSWTSEEEAVIRAKYRHGKAAGIAKEIDRTVVAVRKRARRLGVQGGHRWTDAERQELRSLWGEMSLGHIAKKLRHPKLSVYWQAQQLDLLAVPEGFEGLTQAAERTGYDRKQVIAICEWAGVKVYTRTSRSKEPGHRMRHLDPFDLDEAIEAWLKTESVEDAAKRRGVGGDALRTWLGWAKAVGFDVPPKPTRAKVHWRIPGDLADAVVAWRGGLESVAQAADRVGIGRVELANRLRAAGVKRFSVRPWLVQPGEVDRAIAGEVAA